MATSFDVAKYFLAMTDPEVGDLISNLKLQKLVYYAQGFSLAINGEPLFDGTIEAWDHGPVVRDLYHEYKKFGPDPIPPEENLEEVKQRFTSDQLELLEDVFYVYGQFSAWKLRNMTHEEPPWENAYEDNKIIRHEDMKKYFITLVDDA
jgi:uncharacterized phage-associated protein